ncbi:ATP-binding protein [Streptomyces scopuliridis]|uniref:caspase family protein n=1 Tax=Streptomyces scopuliridis TaxID=452529 RepID=UPI002DDA66C2|nr:caspase family protein [Streptomyces scopuliridis]WSB37358.1 ATP-binding protein [Streptomyces scopuliridis]
MDEVYGRHLTGSDCHAVLVGTGRYQAGSRLTDLPSATRSAAGLAAALHTVCGMPEDQVQLITDPAGPTDVLAAVEAAVDRAEGGVVVFCFAGHGLLGPGDQLYLATGTTSAHSTVHAVLYAEIRNLLSAAPVRPVVILDCCFSGLAEAAQQGPRRDPYVSARPDGSYLLTSATHYASAFAPEGARDTLFCGELLRLLREGDAGGPKWFTLADVYRHLHRRLQGAPARPHADTVGRMGDLVLAANPRYAPAAEPDPAPADRVQDESPCPYPGMRPFLPEQRHLFFGRKELTEALLDRVTRTEPDGPVVLVGPSGVGKSSLLRAGLGAALGAAEPGPVLLVAAPGSRPFHTVTARWAEAVGRPFGEVEHALGAGRFIGPDDGGRGPGILVIDQLASTLAVMARRSQQETAERETVLIAGQLATQADIMRERDPQTAFRLSLAAYRTAEIPETRSSLYASYMSLAPADLKGGVDEPVLNVAFSSDSKVLGTGHRGGRVQLWRRPVVGAQRLYEAAVLEVAVLRAELRAVQPLTVGRLGGGEARHQAAQRGFDLGDLLGCGGGDLRDAQGGRAATPRRKASASKPDPRTPVGARIRNSMSVALCRAPTPGCCPWPAPTSTPRSWTCSTAGSTRTTSASTTGSTARGPSSACMSRRPWTPPNSAC